MLWISDEWKDYEVLDASDGERLERWGKYFLVRPDPQVIWKTPYSHPQWKKFQHRRWALVGAPSAGTLANPL